jgi:hypothetical protein
MRPTSLLLSLLALASACIFVQADSKEPAKTYKEKLLGSTQPFRAKVASVNPAKHIVTVEVKHKGKEPDPQRASELLNLKQQIINAQKNRDFNGSFRLQAEYAKKQADVYKDEVETIDLKPEEDTKLRTLQTPIVYDDKGKPRHLTDRERREYKGPDSRLPGYTADFDGFKTGQLVEIRMARKKPADKTKAADQDDAAEKPLPKVAQILILKEPAK